MDGPCKGFPGALGNKGIKIKYRREQRNMTPVLGNRETETGENSIEGWGN